MQAVVDGFWKCEQTLVDQSANGNDLTGEGGGPAYVEVGDDYWADFDGSNDAAAIAHGSQTALDLTDECGLGFRFRPDRTTPASDGVVGKADGYGNPTDGWGAYLEQTGPPGTVHLVLFVVCDAIRYELDSGNLTSGTEYSIGVRLSVAGSFAKLYLDGSLVDTADIGGDSPDPSDDEFSAGQFANSDFFLGRLNDLWLVGGECPSEQQIADIHTDGFESVYGGLFAELSDQLTAADGLSILIARTLNDNQVVTDGVDAQLVGLHYTRNENQIALDAVSFSLSKAFTDTAVVTDATGFGRFQLAEEEIVAADVLASQSFKRTFEETGGAVDELLGAGWARTLADEVQSADVRACEVSLILTEGLAASDGLESLFITGLLYGAEEQFAASDLLALTMDVVRVDEGAASDALALLAAPTYGELLTAADAGSREPRPLYAELMSATEGLASSAQAVRVDGGALTDALALTMGALPPGETVEPADALSLEAQLAIAEQATLADLLDVLYTQGGLYAETFLAADALALLVQPAFPEELGAGEALTAGVSVRVAEELSATEGMQVEGELHLAEAVAVTDEVRPVLNPLAAAQVGTVEFESVTRNFWWEDVS